MQILHLIAHLHNHHRRQKDPRTNIRHLLCPLTAEITPNSYPSRAATDILKLGFLADNATEDEVPLRRSSHMQR